MNNSVNRSPREERCRHAREKYVRSPSIKATTEDALKMKRRAYQRILRRCARLGFIFG